jgi:hypothetical protein
MESGQAFDIAISESSRLESNDERPITKQQKRARRQKLAKFYKRVAAQVCSLVTVVTIR